MNVLLLFTYGNSLETWENAGILSREIALYQELVNKSVNMKFLTFGTQNDLKFSKKIPKIEIIPVLDLIKSRLMILTIFKSLLLPLKLKTIFQKIDIIKTNQVNGSWIGILAKIFYKKKLIVRGGFEWFRNYLSSANKKGINNYFRYFINYLYIYLIELLAYKLADKIILTNNADINFIIKTFKLKRKNKKGKILHFSNYVDVELFKPLNIPKKDKEIIYIGRLEKMKNLINLLYVFSELEEFTLNIIGEGSLKKELKTKVKDLGIRVNFLGIIPNNKIPEVLNRYEIFILPSYYECNSKTLLEAMSCAIACIGTNVRGIRDIIKHGENGLLCELSSKSIKKAILKLSENSELRQKLGKNARNYILEFCSLEKIAEREYFLYKDLLK